MLNENTVKELSKKLNEPEWLLNKRISAFSSFKALEMPSFKYGIGIFVDVSELNLDQTTPLNEINTFEIINNDEVEVLTFKEALKKHQDLIKKHFLSFIFPYENKLTALHAAFFNNALLVIIPEGKALSKPVQINLNLVAKTQLDHILVIAKENSKATVIEYSSSNLNNGQVFRSHIVEAIVEENAYLEYITIQNFSKSVYNFSKRRSKVDKNGFMYWIDASIGSKFTQALTSTNLHGHGAGSKNWGVIYGDENQCYDLNAETIHAASETTCDMLTRVVLNDKAKTVYRGLVKINPKAVNCQGYQKDDTILLSDDARADVVPNLEIANNDVKCSHGATISQIDEDKLFYMTSRGLDEKTAKKTIVEGFFDPVIVKIQDERIRNEIISSISKRIGSLH